MCNVLVIDDEQMILDLLKQALNRADVQVQTAGDAEGGMAEFDRGRYDLVITDVRMPGVLRFKPFGTPSFLQCGYRSVGRHRRPAIDRAKSTHPTRRNGTGERRHYCPGAFSNIKRRRKVVIICTHLLYSRVLTIHPGFIKLFL